MTVRPATPRQEGREEALRRERRGLGEHRGGCDVPGDGLRVHRGGPVLLGRGQQGRGCKDLGPFGGDGAGAPAGEAGAAAGPADGGAPEPAGAAGEAAAHAAEAEDAEFQDDVRAIPAPRPVRPTQKELEEHAVAHTPYRAWCAACVQGRGRNMDHKRLDAEREHLIDTISVDYAFFGEHDAQAKPVLVLREHRARWTAAVPVLNKGGGDRWAVKAVAEAIRHTGLTHFLFKSDQEVSIVDLKNKVIEELGGGYRIMKEASPVAEHQANGTVERAILTVGGMIRTQKVALEIAYGGELAADHASLPWLIQYSGLLVSLFEVGADGRTAYERTRGKKFRRELPPFGEVVFYLPLDRQKGHLNKLQAKWLVGVYLGLRLDTGELYIGLEQGVVRARAVRRRPGAAARDRSLFDGFRGTPWKPVVASERTRRRQPGTTRWPRRHPVRCRCRWDRR